MIISEIFTPISKLQTQSLFQCIFFSNSYSDFQFIYFSDKEKVCQLFPKDLHSNTGFNFQDKEASYIYQRLKRREAFWAQTLKAICVPIEYTFPEKFQMKIETYACSGNKYLLDQWVMGKQDCVLKYGNHQDLKNFDVTISEYKTYLDPIQKCYEVQCLSFTCKKDYNDCWIKNTNHLKEYSETVDDSTAEYSYFQCD
ncbi:UNVERIFIED_CONTAM: hypothetical protein RMT77_012230 [Armadillidium vulgare]